MNKENLNIPGVIIPMVGTIHELNEDFITVQYLDNYFYGKPIYKNENLPIQGRNVIFFDKEENANRWREPTSEESQNLSPVEVGQQIFFNLKGTWVTK